MPRPLTAALLTSLILSGALAPAVAAPAAPKPASSRIYKVDSVIATSKGRLLVVEAKGAVRTGGWRRAKLHLLRTDGQTLIFEFLADPPPSDMTVIEGLVPVKAAAQIHTRHPVASVRVQADANEVTAQILH